MGKPKMKTEKRVKIAPSVSDLPSETEYPHEAPIDTMGLAQIKIEQRNKSKRKSSLSTGNKDYGSGVRINPS